MSEDADTTDMSGQGLDGLLSAGLRAVVFGNGYLIVAILVVFTSVVLLSRIFKGGTL